MEEQRRLIDVIVDDQELVSQIMDEFYKRLSEGPEEELDFKAIIDGSVEQVFAECEIYEALSRAVEKFRAAPRLDEGGASSLGSFKKPGFSLAEPTQSSQLSRNKSSSPKNESSGDSPLRGKGRISKGKYSPLAPAVSAVPEEGEPTSESATKSESSENATTTSTLKDGFSPPPAVHQTESPDIVEAGYGLGEKKLMNVTAAGEKKAGSHGKNKKGGSTLSPLKAGHLQNDETVRLSPAASPSAERTKKRYPFGSPGSGLEDENFEDSFDGGDLTQDGQGLDFTKRYRFQGGMPAEGEEEEGGLTGGALAEALGGLGEADVNVTDDWLLSRSEGHPDESSLGESFASSLNNSFNSVRSSPSGSVGNRKSSGASPGATPSPGRRLRRSGSKSRSPSPSSSPIKSPVGAERALKGMISSLGASPLSLTGLSPKARSRYGDVRESTESDPGKPSPAASPSAKPALLAKTFPSAGRQKGSPGPGSGSGSPTTPPSGRAKAKGSPVSGGKSPVGADGAGEGGAPASSLTEESSMDSGGPGNLDGGEEIYISDSAPAALSLGKTIRTSGGLQSALTGQGGDMADDFVDDFEDEGEIEEEYEQDEFASDKEEDRGWEVEALAPRASSSSPTRIAKKGKLNTSKSSEKEEEDDEDGDGYGSDDFEMMDYEKDDKPNRKRVRFPRESVVTDVHVTREKHGVEEKEELFYSHDETTRFTLDYSKETMKAEMAGLTWNDWWEGRGEDDVQRDEEEEQARQASGEDWYGDYYDYDDEGGFEDFEIEVDMAAEEDEEVPSMDDSNEFSNF